MIITAFYECHDVFLTWLHDGVNMKKYRIKAATRTTMTNPITTAKATAHLKLPQRSAGEPLGRWMTSKLSISILTSISVSFCPAWCLSIMQTVMLVVEPDFLLLNIAHDFPHTKMKVGIPNSVNSRLSTIKRKQKCVGVEGIPLNPCKKTS